METDSSLSAHEIGKGTPILIIHGWELDGKAEELDFEPIFTKFAAGRLRRIYVDLPGMGTTPGNNVKDLDEMFLRLTHFIDSRIGSSKFLLMGSSAGGYLARALAQKYTGQVDGLLLRVPLIEPKNELRDVDGFQPLVQNDQLISSMSSEDKALLRDVHIQTPAYINTLKAKYKAVLPSLKAADNGVLDPIRADPQRYQLTQFASSSHDKFLAPTLILCGRQDEVVGYRDSLRLLELYPRSTYAVLDRGRHDLPVDENVLFEALVRDWLNRVEEWRAHT